MVAGGFLWGTKSWTRPNWRSFNFWTWKSAAGQIGISPIEIVWYAWLGQFFYLALQRGVGADVLEETWLVVDPQLLLLLLALLVVLVQLAHLREETNNFPFLRKVSSLHTLVWIKFSSSQSTESKQIRDQKGNVWIWRKIIVFFRELMDQSWILSEKPDHQNLRNQNFNVQKSSPGLSL